MTHPVDLAKMRTRGEGVKKPENFADVLYVWPLNQSPVSFQRKWQLLQYAMFGAFYPNYFLRTRGNQG